MKVLVLDIETRPAQAYVFGLYDQNIGIHQITDPGGVICFAAKWVGQKKIIYKSTYHHSHEEMVKTAWQLMDEADAIVHFNGKAFDMKHLHREFLLAGMTPPSPHKDIDLLTVARGRFKFLSNKLDNLANELGIGSKVKHTGFELWLGCIANDPASWKMMKEYNIHDVVLTEKLYVKLLSWVKNHPSVPLHDGDDGEACRNCGSHELQRRGFAYTTVSRYQKVVCKDCGTWGQLGTRDGAATLRAVG